MTTIKSPAKRSSSGKLTTGKEHDAIKTKGQKGFKTSDGKFVNREKAEKMAEKSGQVKHKHKYLHSKNLKTK